MDSFQQQALGFNVPNADFDPSSAPTDGEQYLQRVFYERTKCPAVVVRPLKSAEPTSQKTNPANIWHQYTREDIGDCANVCLLPTTEWSRHQTRTFKSLRNKISALRARHSRFGSNRVRSREEITCGFPPDDDDAIAWQVYCKKNEPLLSTMFTIQQRTLEKLVEHQSNWLIDDIQWYDENAKWLSRWIYGSLACLHLPLEPNVHNSLRQIAKNSIRLRNQMGANDTDIINVLPLNLIICIVAHNFNQLDLCGRTR